MRNTEKPTMLSWPWTRQRSKCSSGRSGARGVRGGVGGVGPPKLAQVTHKYEREDADNVAISSFSEGVTEIPCCRGKGGITLLCWQVEWAK